MIFSLLDYLTGESEGMDRKSKRNPTFKGNFPSRGECCRCWFDNLFWTVVFPRIFLLGDSWFLLLLLLWLLVMLLLLLLWNFCGIILLLEFCDILVLLLSWTLDRLIHWINLMLLIFILAILILLSLLLSLCSILLLLFIASVVITTCDVEISLSCFFQFLLPIFRYFSIGTVNILVIFIALWFFFVIRV